MTIEEYIVEANRAQIAYGYRYGQALFNVLHDNIPDLASMVRGGEIDPFHLNRRVPEFLQWLAPRLRDDKRPLVRHEP